MNWTRTRMPGARRHPAALLLLAGIAGTLLVLAPAGPAPAGAAVAPASPRGVLSVSSGGNHSCAVLANHKLYCWGRNEWGQLGYGNVDSIGNVDGDTPGPVRFGHGHRVLKVSTGYYHTCAILDDHTLRCWGHDLGGLLGYPDQHGDLGDDEGLTTTGPVDLGPGRTARQVTMGRNHTCALLDDHTVRCWGNDHDGEVGYGPPFEVIGDDETPGSVGPVDLGPGRTALSISAGEFHTCAVLDDHTIRCWGANGFGVLGYGREGPVGDDETPGSLAPVDLGVGRTARSISAGGDHTCAVLDDRSVRCWGRGVHGTVGYPNNDEDNDIGDDEAPASIGPVRLGAGRTALQVSAGFGHTCALLDNHAMRCWGRGTWGQLGYGNLDDVGDDENPGAVGPVSLGPGRRAVRIELGESQSCAILDNAKLRCWGFNEGGELGLGHIENIGDNELPSSQPTVAFGRP